MSKPTAFPLDESRLPFEIPRNEPYREKIARLGQMITDRIPAKKGILTKDDPEYWGLASIVTDEMADVALKMKVRKPMTLPELVKATGKPAGELEPLLQQMAVVGLLEYNWENPRRIAFSRDGYTFVFNSYRLPADQWTTIRIEGDYKGTSLYINGALQERLEGRTMQVYRKEYDRMEHMTYQETLIFPLQQIGDSRNGFKGKLKNILVRQQH